ncbi:MAG: hypothetical protein AAF959_02120 [Cyanobacteria bacterium P01_D01_bin.56]
MLDNPDLIASLIGVDGLLAIALTAIATRLFSDGTRAERLENAKDKILGKVADLEAAVQYAQGRLEGLTEILADGRVTPAEVSTMKSEVTSIKDRIGEIVNGGGDVA